MSVQDQRSRPISERASPHDVIGLGIAFAIAGLYFMLGSTGLAPMPETNGPDAIVFCAGAAFLFAGLTCFVRARAGLSDTQDDMPDEAPRGLRLSYRMLGIAVAASLATIGTWIAIGAGPRAFSVTAPFAPMQTTGESVGRTVFGLGAVIVWIYVIALTVGTVRKIMDRRA